MMATVGALVRLHMRPGPLRETGALESKDGRTCSARGWGTVSARTAKQRTGREEAEVQLLVAVLGSAREVLISGLRKTRE